MANSKTILIAFVISISSLNFAQILPTYPERSFNSFSDSSFSKYMQASEGIINPEEYKVGPGDNIFISISGIEERDFNLLINHEGFLYIPRVGAVDLRNKSLEDAKVSIRSTLEKNFKDVDIYIALGEVRKIKVSLIGNVTNQSSIVLTSNSRLQDLLKSSAGLNVTSDIRNIKIISKDGTVGTYDLLSFFRKGDLKQNPYLRDGDIVLIEPVNKVISIMGHVLYPASYEFKEGETIFDLINLAGGFTYKARLDSIELIRFDEDGLNQFSEYYSYNYLKENQVELRYSDLVCVRELTPYYDEQWVTINGEVKFPGIYKIIKNETTLSQIINEAGGFLKDASIVDATLYRSLKDTTYDAEFERIRQIPRADMTDDEYDYIKAKSRQRSGKVVVDFDGLFQKKQLSEDLILKKEDLISVPEKKNYITIIGQVVNPGSIIYDENLTIKDYIKSAGGFSWRAVEGDVRLIKANTGEWIEEDNVEFLEPGDTIWVLENPPGPKFWDIFLTSLTVVAQLAAIVAASVAVIVSTR